MLNLHYISDRRLIERIRENDREVLGELYLRYEKLIFNFVRTQGGSAEDADDLLQETIVALWKNAAADDFSLSSKLSTYLMAIARNKWLADRRKRYHQARGDMPPDIKDNQPGALHALIDHEQEKRIQDIFRKISAVCRELLSLFYFEECSLQTIANIMDFANTDVVKSKKYQCKKALEKILIEDVQLAGRGMK